MTMLCYTPSYSAATDTKGPNQAAPASPFGTTGQSTPVPDLQQNPFTNPPVQPGAPAGQQQAPRGQTPAAQPAVPASPDASKVAPAARPSADAPRAIPSRRGSPSQRISVGGAGGGSTFFFDDADVFEVVQTVFGDVLQLNYIIDPQVKGRVNFRTTSQIPREKILPIMEIILRLNGIAVVEESDLYRIIPIGNISREPAPIRFGKDPGSVDLKGTSLIQIVPLMFVNSSEMMNILQPLLTQGGTIYDLPKRNVLMIADTDANIRRLLQVVKMFDEDNYRSVYQQKIYIYPLQNSKADHVSKILSSLLLGASGGGSVGGSRSGVTSVTGAKPAGTSSPGAAAGAPAPAVPASPFAGGQSSADSVVAVGTKIYPDEVTNSVVIYASPGDYALILAALKQLDSIPRQVMIEAIVASVELTDNLTLGVRWNVGNVKVSAFGKHVAGPLGFSNLPNPFAPGGNTSTFAYTGLDSANNVRLAIEALAEDNKAKILSSPHILVADNREARIQVGQQIPIATATTTTPLGTGSGTVNTTSSSIQYKDTGTILKVKPQVNDSGLISLEITQEVSAAKTVPVLGTDQYVISKSEVSTNMIAQDGQTIVIGGLVTETVDYGRSGIPLLSKIPVLGYLFGQTTDKTVRQELVILLTPRVVRDQREAAKVTSDYFEMFKNLDKEMQFSKKRKNQTDARDMLPGQPQQPAPEQQQTPQQAPKPAPSDQNPSQQGTQQPAPAPSPSSPHM